MNKFLCIINSFLCTEHKANVIGRVNEIRQFPFSALLPWYKIARKKKKNSYGKFQLHYILLHSIKKLFFLKMACQVKRRVKPKEGNSIFFHGSVRFDVRVF